MKPPLLHIQDKDATTQCASVLKSGFRIFFLGAGVFATTAIAQWMGIYIFGFPLSLEKITAFQWHAHEMIYGFSLAVIAGFLLTAAGNWTNTIIIDGRRLAGVFTLWTLARILWMFGDRFALTTLVAESVFVLWVLYALAKPIVQKRQWKQFGLLSKVFLLGLTNSCFYLGYFGYLDIGITWGIYGGLYLVIGVILTMGRRVLPFFIERGVDYPVQLRNSRWLDLSSLVLFLLFFFAELFFPHSGYAGMIAVPLFLVTTLRLAGWYTQGIWRVPLLWSLYLSFVFIAIGFLMYSLIPMLGINKFLAVHALAFGGIGVVTIAMMARVSLGHTGREVANPPRAVTYMMAAIVAGAFVRIAMPVVLPAFYVHWVLVSQLLWIAAFALFVLTYCRILVSEDCRTR